MLREESRKRLWTRVLGIMANTVFAVGVLIYVGFYTDTFSNLQRLVVLFVALVPYTATRALIRIFFRT